MGTNAVGELVERQEAMSSEEREARRQIIEEKGVFFFSAPLIPGQAPVGKASADALIRNNMDSLIDTEGLLDGAATEQYFRDLLA